MIPIKKLNSPQILQDYRHNKNANFNDFDGKEIVKDYLVREQFGLCAYCMNRISNEVSYVDDERKTHLKIEHFRPQSEYPSLQLDYKNMLGCCNGNEGRPYKFQTCDTRKRNDLLMFNPSDANDSNKMDIRFYKDGTIHSGNKDFDKQLNEILNLNEPQLVSSRKALLDAAFNVLNKKKGTRTKSEVQNMINNYSAVNNGVRKPFYYVVVYYLQKHLK